MSLYLASLAILVAGGAAAFALSFRSPAGALTVASASAAVGCAVGLAAVAPVLAGGPPLDLSAAWAVPLGQVHLRVDALAAFFQVVIFGLGIVTALFGREYLRAHAARRSLGSFLLFFNVLLAAMSAVVAARHAVLFLVAWEVMSVSSFLLVAFEHGDREVRAAARLYLVASHLGVTAIVALFLLLGRGAGSLDFDAFAAARGAAAPATLLFALGVVGFGVKAGLFPMHVWLPEAHPAAPSHVSALMSGALVKTGVYGLLRTLEFLPPAPVGWGLALAAIGVAGALTGIALALSQRDLKRTLAFSTVENVGIIALGLGAGMSGLALGWNALAGLALCGALLHVWNHALMKGLAFLAAGAIVHGAGTRDLERMGGLLRRMPASGALFLIAAAALSALPPLNGFASEWLVYLGLLDAARGAPGAGALIACAGLAAVAIVGAVAAVAFTRAAGIALLGEPRGEGAARAHDPGPMMLAPLAALAGLCLLLGFLPRVALPFVARAAGHLGVGEAASLAAANEALGGVLPVALGALAIGLAVALARLVLLRRGERRAAPTWGCGFARPTSRMQYGASSYAQLFVRTLLPKDLQPVASTSAPHGLFPRRASLALRPQDPARERFFDPFFRALADRSARLRQFQQGRLNLQLLYTFAALVALLLLLAIRTRFR
jgi:formate hydrogenlyase subunit 3/multisubunit Na+/H+ antiporter MnhD subunit